MTQINIPMSPTNYGWICPRCQKVHAPWVASCSCSTSNGLSPYSSSQIGDYPSEPYR